MLGVMTVRKEGIKFREFDRYRGVLLRAVPRHRPALRQKPAEWRSVLR